MASRNLAASDTSSTDSAPARPAPDPSGAVSKATRLHSIGGKLLLAFGLIAALTIGAALLSLIRFNQVESVLHDLIDVSLPALKLSMDVQVRAADVIETAGDVGNARNETERFTGMSAATDRISALWQAVEQLRTVVDDKKMGPIQKLIARIDSQVGDLNRTVGEGLACSRTPEHRPAAGRRQPPDQYIACPVPRSA
jgi:phosphoglycerate-specific signal transduction histidine kinase